MGCVLGMPLKKVFQYTNDEKVNHGLSYTSIKTTQANIWKCIVWPKEFRKKKTSLEKKLHRF
jgi:hypothetical protein